MSPDNKKYIEHSNDILKKIQHHFTFSERGFAGDLDYKLLFNELTKIYYDLPFHLIERTLLELKLKTLNFNHEEFVRICAEIPNDNNKKQEEYNFYLQLNHSINNDITFKSFKISQLAGEEKAEIIRQIKITAASNGFNKLWIENPKMQLYVFKIKSHSDSDAKEKFYSIFHLYKGALEFSYLKFRWNVIFPRLVKNKKEESCFKYPPFIYIRTYRYIDFIVHEDYPYNYMELDANIKDKGSLKYFEMMLTLLNNSLDSSLDKVLADSLRLYGKAIDTPYFDQAFLYFWNVLECVTLSISGNTEQVIKRIQIYFSDDFWNTYTESINSLRKIRNDRVHAGKGDINLMDLNFLKYLCDYAIFFHIGNPPGSQENIKTCKQLQAFYSIKDNHDLMEIKEVIDFVLLTKKNNRQRM